MKKRKNSSLANTETMLSEFTAMEAFNSEGIASHDKSN